MNFFGWKMVRNAVRNAFLDTLTVATPFLFDFISWNGVLTRFPSKRPLTSEREMSSVYGEKQKDGAHDGFFSYLLYPLCVEI